MLLLLLHRLHYISNNRLHLLLHIAVQPNNIWFGELWFCQWLLVSCKGWFWYWKPLWGQVKFPHSPVLDQKSHVCHCTIVIICIFSDDVLPHAGIARQVSVSSGELLENSCKHSGTMLALYCTHHEHLLSHLCYISYVSQLMQVLMCDAHCSRVVTQCHQLAVIALRWQQCMFNKKPKSSKV